MKQQLTEGITTMTEPESGEPIRHLLQEMVAAIDARDIDAILALYSEEAVIFDVRDALKIDREGLRQSWQECFDSAEDFHFSLQQPYVKMSGDIAFCHSLSHSVVPSKKVDVWMRSTFCFQKMAGKWLITHEHDSVPVDFSTGRILESLNPETQH